MFLQFTPLNSLAVLYIFLIFFSLRGGAGILIVGTDLKNRLKTLNNKSLSVIY